MRHSVHEIERAEWNRLMRDVVHANLLQSWEYGVAKESAEQWRAVRLVVEAENGNPVALAQFLCRELPLAGGIARLNRGPLLLGRSDRDELAVSLAATAALLRECVRRRWWVAQLAPEIPNSPVAVGGLAKLGLRRLPTPAWASTVLSLTPPEEDLMKGLNGKWRNCLRKGIRLNVAVRKSDGGTSDLEMLTKQYTRLQAERDFAGMSSSILASLASRGEEGWEFALFFAAEQGGDAANPVGTLVTVRSGDTATYLIGSTTSRGRELQANYVLLWEAIRHAARSGCKWFDLGGLAAATPAGIAHFKRGVNAEPYELVGEWRWFGWPFRRVPEPTAV